MVTFPGAPIQFWTALKLNQCGTRKCSWASWGAEMTHVGEKEWPCCHNDQGQPGHQSAQTCSQTSVGSITRKSNINSRWSGPYGWTNQRPTLQIRTDSRVFRVKGLGLSHRSQQQSGDTACPPAMSSRLGFCSPTAAESLSLCKQMGCEQWTGSMGKKRSHIVIFSLS